LSEVLEKTKKSGRKKVNGWAQDFREEMTETEGNFSELKCCIQFIEFIKHLNLDLLVRNLYAIKYEKSLFYLFTYF
jgi:hypothetical protein